ncbi:hypothetical protein ABT332_01985 [Saccharomonospora azurea]|uniref:hypothetical protein n=1 Tax=Saccharomonospora azurea TaxID=40988 RepID=UPI00332CD10D
MRGRGVASIAMVAAVTVGLSACSSSDEGTARAGVENETTAASTSAGDASSAPPDSSASEQEITPPGTTLKVGETATVPYRYGESEGTIAITVTDIVKGEKGDLADFGDGAEGLVPFFVKYTVENVGGTDLAYSSLNLQAVASDGDYTGVFVTGDVEGKCVTASADADFSTAGAFYESCSVQAAHPGREVAGAAFDRDDYSDDPVVWMK